MNILQIFPGKVWGGAEQYVLDLSIALIRCGHQVSFLAHNNQAIQNRLCDQYQVSTLPFVCTLDLYSIIQLSHIIKADKIDVIHVHDTKFVPLVIMAKRWSKSNVRIVFTRHIARSSKVNPLYRKAFKELHTIIFVSELAQKMWISSNPWMPTDKCRVILNSIPSIPQKTHESLRKKYGISSDVQLIVFTGRIRRSKGCAILIEALAIIKHLPYHLVFIGTCKPKSYSNRLLKLAQDKGIGNRVSFYGFSNRTRELIKEADIGVAPSIVREACPLSPMEFMQAGKCVITTNNGAQPEYILSEKNGILITPNNMVELSTALCKVIEYPDFRKEIGKEAKSYFDHQLNYDEFIELILKSYKKETK